MSKSDKKKEDPLLENQDKKSNEENNESPENKLKSTAILFKGKGQLFVKFFYIIFIAIIGYLGFKSSNSMVSIAVILLFMLFMIIYLNKWKMKSNTSSNHFFKINNYIGLFSFIYLITF